MTHHPGMGCDDGLGTPIWCSLWAGLHKETVLNASTGSTGNNIDCHTPLGREDRRCRPHLSKLPCRRRRDRRRRSGPGCHRRRHRRLCNSASRAGSGRSRAGVRCRSSAAHSLRRCRAGTHLQSNKHGCQWLGHIYRIRPCPGSGSRRPRSSPAGRGSSSRRRSTSRARRSCCRRRRSG
jgi:hypothetical protein